jgi:hypothetical protein
MNETAAAIKPADVDGTLMTVSSLRAMSWPNLTDAPDARPVQVRSQFAFCP